MTNRKDQNRESIRAAEKAVRAAIERLHAETGLRVERFEIDWTLGGEVASVRADRVMA